MHADAEIVLNGVTMGYVRGQERISIFSDLHMAIPSGDFVAVMGPSGSGKSTLLNLVGGLSRPLAGGVSVGDLSIERMTERELSKWRASRIGFVSQFYNLLPILTAAENVELPLMLKALPRQARRARVAGALELVGLEGREKHRPSELSGGQQQRVAIARAVVADPDIILADEPTGDLDRESAIEILLLLQTLNRELGKTIVLVTHDATAAKYAKRTLHLDKGTFAERLDLVA